MAIMDRELRKRFKDADVALSFDNRKVNKNVILVYHSFI